MPDSSNVYSSEYFPSEPGPVEGNATYSFYDVYKEMLVPTPEDAIYNINSFGRTMIRNITMFRNTGFQEDCPTKCKLCTKNFDCVLLEDDSVKLYGTTVVDKCPPHMKTAGYDDPTIENNPLFANSFAKNNMICTRKRVSPIFYQIKDQSKKDFNTEPQGVGYLGRSEDGTVW